MTSWRDRFFKPFLAGLALLLLASTHFSQRLLTRQRGELGLTRVAPLENAPPVLAFTTVALGGFRGLIANVLWVRATEMQEEGKYFEMVQLADWITKLQPHFSTVWVHLAWNMAYNISIKFTDPKERWLWILRGIELLRDEGIKYNPKEPLIYRELGWFFQHKIGHYMDDAHNAYKTFWAAEMDTVLGSGRPDFAELIEPKTDQGRERARLLRAKYKMDPRWMKEVDTRYGPLEWRLPETHAIYWAIVGLEYSRHEEIKKEDFIQLRRVIFQSMQLAFHRGRLIYPSGNRQQFLYGPNLEIVKQTNKAYEDQIEVEPELAEHLGNAHKNFLKTAVYFLYSHNRMTAAKQWFDYVRKKYPASVPPEMTLDTYALAKLSEDATETDPNRIKSLIEGLIETYYISLALGEDDEASGHELLAQRLRERYELAVGDPSRPRVGLPPLAEIKAEVLRRLFTPEFGLDPAITTQLRSRLGLPAVTTTNTPPANSAAPGTALPPAQPAPPPSPK